MKRSPTPKRTHFLVRRCEGPPRPLALRFAPRAVKEFGALALRDRKRIAAVIDKLANEPRPPGCKRLQDNATSFASAAPTIASLIES